MRGLSSNRSETPWRSQLEYNWCPQHDRYKYFLENLLSSCWKGIHIFFFFFVFHMNFLVTVGIIWDTDSPSADYIVDTMDCMTERLYMSDVGFGFFVFFYFFLTFWNSWHLRTTLFSSTTPLQVEVRILRFWDFELSINTKYLPEQFKTNAKKNTLLIL